MRKHKTLAIFSIFTDVADILSGTLFIQILCGAIFLTVSLFQLELVRNIINFLFCFHCPGTGDMVEFGIILKLT